MAGRYAFDGVSPGRAQAVFNLVNFAPVRRTARLTLTVAF
jgi:hypothetical protein